MRNIKFILSCSIIFSFLSINLFAQAGLSESISENVEISLKKGLQLTNAGGDLLFDEVLVGAPTTVSKTPDQGVKFRVDGTAGPVTITYSSVTLTNGPDNLTFNPDVETTDDDPSYTGASTVNSGDAPSILNAGSGDGSLYLWVGGSIDVGATATQGNYVGSFSLTVAY